MDSPPLQAANSRRPIGSGADVLSSVHVRYCSIRSSVASWPAVSGK